MADIVLLYNVASQVLFLGRVNKKEISPRIKLLHAQFLKNFLFKTKIEIGVQAWIPQHPPSHSKRILRSVALVCYKIRLQEVMNLLNNIGTQLTDKRTESSQQNSSIYKSFIEAEKNKFDAIWNLADRLTDQFKLKR